MGGGEVGGEGELGTGASVLAGGAGPHRAVAAAFRPRRRAVQRGVGVVVVVAGWANKEVGGDGGAAGVVDGGVAVGGVHTQAPHLQTQGGQPRLHVPAPHPTVLPVVQLPAVVAARHTTQGAAPLSHGGHGGRVVVPGVPTGARCSGRVVLQTLSALLQGVQVLRHSLCKPRGCLFKTPIFQMFLNKY